MVVTNRIDDEITLYLRKEGVTQQQFASSIGMSDVSLIRKRKGDVDWWASEIVQLCKILKKTPNDLISVAFD